jgi:uncharacterized protein (TIGR03435 family)
MSFHLLAQVPSTSSKPSFEVASVKPNKTADNRMMLGGQPGGGLTVTNMPLQGLITWAYELQEFQIVGAPDWISNERFDIVAKATVDRPVDGPIGPPGPGTRSMMQSLLADRFNLAVHTEKRPMQIYALVTAKSDGKLGAQLKPSTVDCEAMRNQARGRGPAAPPPWGERPVCGMMMRPGGIAAGGMPISNLIGPLAVFTRRIVIDRTNLKGNYDIDFTWTPDQMPAGPMPPGLPAIDPNGPSIFTAIQEQLGLKLESVTEPVDVLVIDHIERPTPD